jgi:hypothetical protein
MSYLSVATREKTYTFRASGDLGERASKAFSVLARVLEDASGNDLENARAAFWLAVLRRAPELEQTENQSALFRTTLEVFIEAAEKLAADREYVRAYEDWAAEDEEGEAWREGTLEAAADRWAE